MRKEKTNESRCVSMYVAVSESLWFRCFKSLLLLYPCLWYSEKQTQKKNIAHSCANCAISRMIEISQESFPCFFPFIYGKAGGKAASFYYFFFLGKSFFFISPVSAVGSSEKEILCWGQRWSKIDPGFFFLSPQKVEDRSFIENPFLILYSVLFFLFFFYSFSIFSSFFISVHQNWISFFLLPDGKRKK